MQNSFKIEHFLQKYLAHCQEKISLRQEVRQVELR